MSLFTPKRLIVKPQSKNSSVTKEIIDRTRKYNPDVAVEYLKGKEFTYPVSTPREKYLYMKESAIISERSESFIRTFDSPGDIIESLTTVLNLSWMCANSCEFCYLQTNQTPEHYFYTNREDAEHEISASPAAHAATLTLWTHLSSYFGKRLDKLPDRFKEATDWLREFYVKARVSTDSEAIDRYYLSQKQLVELLNESNISYEVDQRRFQRDRATIGQWYRENLKYPLTLTASEFNDFLAVDHLTDSSSFLMDMVEKYPRFNFTVRSRSTYLDGFLRHDGQDRGRFNITLNTKFAIDEFEHGTATLDERIHAARRVQEARGFALSIVLEPMLTYEGYLEDYKRLIRRVLTELEPKRISRIILGSARYADQLKAMIRLHYPGTKLFGAEHNLVPPVKPDTKHRYDPEERRNLYAAVIGEIRAKSDVPVSLGSETPLLWESLGMDKNEELARKVFEADTVSRSSDDMTVKEESAPMVPASESDAAEMPAVTGAVANNSTANEHPFWVSISPQDPGLVEESIADNEARVPLDRLTTAVNTLRAMATFREERDAGTNEVAGYPVNDAWDIENSRSLADLVNTHSYFTPAKVVGRIAQLADYTPREISGRGTMSFISLQIADTEETMVETLEIQADCLHVDLVKLQKDRVRCVFLGMVVPYYPKKGKGRARFFLHDILTTVEPLDNIRWRPGGDGAALTIDGKRYPVSNDHPSMMLQTLSGPNAVIKYIASELSQHLGIEALDKAIHLKRALEFVILQAFSQGRGEILEKLHGLVIGPPNVGKSYLTKAALVLNHIGQEISSSSRKVTEAGLVGTVKPGSKKSVSVPGVLPLNHGGVVCIQEFHDIRGMTRKSLCALFVRMMEEGQVIESTSAATIHPAETALLVDMNRYSHVNPSGKFDSFSDIDIPVNMLARFDYIVDIPRDEERSKSTATQMTEGFKTMGSKQPADADPWANRLRYLVAFLKSEYRTVHFPDAVRKEIERKVDAMLSDVRVELQALVEDMRLRIVRSAFKLTKAVATANVTNEATQAHADFALQFVQDKVNFVRGIKLDDLPEEKPSINEVDKRRELIDKQFRGKRFEISEVREFLSTHMEGECENRTIQRDLGVLGAKPLKNPKGAWSLK